MTRPLERLGIAELEELFKNPKITADELKTLEGELECRSTARAENLLSEVKKSVKVKEIIAKARTRVAQKQLIQLELPSVADFELSSNAPAPSTQVTYQPKVVTSTPAPQKSPSVNADPAMTKEQAFKILKVSPTTSWEQIEQSRRELVARAQPDMLAVLAPEIRKALQDECRLVNAAYKSLLQGKP